MLDWADWLTGPNPYARSPLCLSALQLTLNDKEKVIHDLNKQDREDPPKIPILSISGGQNYLEFGKPSARAFTGAVRNTLLQRLIGENPNDGLVAESSANLSQVLGISTSLMQHQNKYADYRRTNHTHLIRNQAITNLIVQWLQKDLSL